MPLTHRGKATGVRYVTGHRKNNGELDLNWQSLADPDTTLVVYMGLSSLPLIRDALIRRQNAKGAWDKGSRHGGGGYSTPMAIIILATPHRYIPIYQR